MTLKLFASLLSAGILGLTACRGVPTATIPPSPEPAHVSYSPYLAGIQDALHACAASAQEIAIFFHQKPSASQEFDDQDLVIWWGESPPGMNFAYPLGEDELVVIVNPGNPKSQLSRSELKALFSGGIESWTQIGTLDQPVNLWLFPEGNRLSEVFKDAVLGDQRYSRLASVAPSSQAMLEAVEDDPGGIGILPRSWLSQQVKQVQIDNDLQDSLHAPLLAITGAEPVGGLKTLLACLQTGAGQAVLAKHYDYTQ